MKQKNTLKIQQVLNKQVHKLNELSRI